MKKKWIKFLIFYKNNKVFFWIFNLTIGTLFSPLFIITRLITLSKKYIYEEKREYIRKIYYLLEDKCIEDSGEKKLYLINFLIWWSQLEEKYKEKYNLLNQIADHSISVIIIYFLKFFMYMEIDYLLNVENSVKNDIKKLKENNIDNSLVNIEKTKTFKVSIKNITEWREEPDFKKYKNNIFNSKYVNFWEIIDIQKKKIKEKLTKKQRWLRFLGRYQFNTYNFLNYEYDDHSKKKVFILFNTIVNIFFFPIFCLITIFLEDKFVRWDYCKKKELLKELYLSINFLDKKDEDNFLIWCANEYKKYRIQHRKYYLLEGIMNYSLIKLLNCIPYGIIIIIKDYILEKIRIIRYQPINDNFDGVFKKNLNIVEDMKFDSLRLYESKNYSTHNLMCENILLEINRRYK